MAVYYVLQIAICFICTTHVPVYNISSFVYIFMWLDATPE